MSAPTAARATLSEIELRLEQIRGRGPGRPMDGRLPIEWLEEQLTWLQVLHDCLPSDVGGWGRAPDVVDERARCVRLIAVIAHELAGRRAQPPGPVSWAATGPGAQLM